MTVAYGRLRPTEHPLRWYLPALMPAKDILHCCNNRSKVARNRSFSTVQSTDASSSRIIDARAPSDKC